MKRFLFLILALVVFKSFGQDYLLFPPTCKKLFSTTSFPTKGYSLSFDSVVVSGNDTNYYNFFNVPDTLYNFPIGTCVFWASGCMCYQDFPTWIGKKVEHTSSGLYRFFNCSNDTLTFDLSTPIGDTTLFFSDAAQRFFLIHDPDDSITVLGNSDSAKYFRVYHTDNSGNEISSSLDQKKIICAKQLGLISFFQVDSFPQVLRPLSLIGSVSPSAGLNVITNETLYDHQAGDELQFHELSDQWTSEGYDRYRKYIFLSRTDLTDTIRYTVHQILFYADSSSVTLDDTIQLTYFRHDTIATIPFERYDGRSKSLTYQDYCGQHLWTYSIHDLHNLAYCPDENCWGYYDTGGPPPNEYLTYVIGLGIYFHGESVLAPPPMGYSFGTNINYFKKNGIVCGSQQFVGINNIDANRPTVSILPNPAIGNLYVNASSTIEKIELFDLSGRIVRSNSIHAKTITIDVDDLSGGLYFAHVIFSDKRVFNSKIVIGSK